jgi:hypothetical protein
MAQPLLGRNSTILFRRRSVLRNQRHSGALPASSRYKQFRPRGHDCGALLRWTGGGACPYVVRAGFRKFLCDPLCPVCLNS